MIPPVIESCKTIFEDAVHTEYQNRIPSDRVLHIENEFDPAHAHHGCPGAKVIFTLRNPIIRAYEQFHHALAEKKETVKTFEHAMDSELSNLRSPDTTGRCWIYKNQYQTHIEHWLSFFPRKKIFIMVYEEWTSPSKQGLKELEKFLGFQSNSLSQDAYKEMMQETGLIVEEPPPKSPPLSDATKELLEEIFELDKNFVSNYIGRNIPKWKI